jgi:phospholipase/carboxylesterase
MNDDPIEIETGSAPRTSLIVLHGLGASGDDFVPVCEALDLAGAGSVRFVFPHAPMRPVTINGGYVMRAWYDIVASDLARREDEAGLRASRDAIDALIERERARGVASERIVLMGFSQGCALALMAGLRHAERLGGVVGLSGYLPLAPLTAAERSDANRDLPVFLAHGVHDPVVPIARALASRELLRALGHPVEWHDYPIEHTVSMPEIDDVGAWLRRRLA